MRLRNHTYLKLHMPAPQVIHCSMYVKLESIPIVALATVLKQALRELKFSTRCRYSRLHILDS
jgi:hypothetical protein